MVSAWGITPHGSKTVHCRQMCWGSLYGGRHIWMVGGTSGWWIAPCSLLFFQSQASFVASGNRTDISLDDPNFWQKWAKIAELDTDAKNEKVGSSSCPVCPTTDLTPCGVVTRQELCACVLLLGSQRGMCLGVSNYCNRRLTHEFWLKP